MFPRIFRTEAEEEEFSPFRETGKRWTYKLWVQTHRRNWFKKKSLVLSEQGPTLWRAFLEYVKAPSGVWDKLGLAVISVWPLSLDEDLCVPSPVSSLWRALRPTIPAHRVDQMLWGTLGFLPIWSSQDPMPKPWFYIPSAQCGISFTGYWLRRLGDWAVRTGCLGVSLKASV